MANFRQNTDGTMGVIAEATGAEVARLGGGPAVPSLATPLYEGLQTVKFPLPAGAAAGVITAAWPVPAWCPNGVIVEWVCIDIITASTGASTINVGAAANSTTASGTLIPNNNTAAVAVLDGKTQAQGQKLTGSMCVTFAVATGNQTGMVANAYITFKVV